MAERPIIFSGPMVKAILEGRKTQTRRVVRRTIARRVEPEDDRQIFHVQDPHVVSACPYGRPGDRLWVRETHYRWTGCGEAPSHWRRSPDSDRYQSRGYADDAEIGAIRFSAACVTVPAIHMPRWASRITMEIVNVRVERLQSITEEDAKAEGVTPSIVGQDLEGLKFRAGFQSLWDQINGKRAPWESNPYVWVIEFKRVGS